MNDHRQLGRELGLFDSDPLIGAGLPYWLPAGAAIRHAIEEFVREVERRAGYQHVYSPVLGKRELYEISGHWAHYRDDMFPPMGAGSDQMVLRPSLCPHHALIYRSRQRSYRELPLRLAELGGQFREEASGALGGLTRVRAMQLNDAHVFCPPADIATEVAAILDMIGHAYDALGISAHHYRLSLRGGTGKYAGDAGMWDRGELALTEVLDRRGLRYESAAGEGAFYGPKIDVQILDPAGRESNPVDRPARLLSAQAVRAGLRRRGPEPATPGHDPPQHRRQPRAAGRPPDRGARGRVPDLDGARPGGRAPRRLPAAARGGVTAASLHRCRTPGRDLGPRSRNPRRPDQKPPAGALAGHRRRPRNRGQHRLPASSYRAGP